MSNVTDEIREDLRRRQEEHGSKYWAEFSEAQAVELASGYVCAEVRAMFLSMLSWMDEDRRTAERAAADARKQARA